MMKTVLMVSPTYLPVMGGSEIYSADLCKYLSGKGHRVYLIGCTFPLKGKYKMIENGKNYRIFRIPCLNRRLLEKTAKHPLIYPLMVIPPLFFFSFLFLLIQGREVDVIHAQSVSAGLIVLILSAIFGKRRVVTTHGKYFSENPYHLQYNKYARFIGRVFGKFDRVLAINEQSREELARIGVKAENIKVAPHWVDQEIFKPEDKKTSKAALGWEGKFIVFYAGRFVEDKGIENLISAAKSAKNKAVFAFAGTGPLQRAVIDASISHENILYLGEIDTQKMPLYYNAADLVIIASRHAGDGIPRVIMETLSCGTPVIGANRGGIPDVLTPQVGMLIEPTVKEINSAIERLFEDRVLLDKLTGNCRKYAQEKFSMKNAEIAEGSYYEDH